MAKPVRGVEVVAQGRELLGDYVPAQSVLSGPLMGRFLGGQTGSASQVWTLHHHHSIPDDSDHRHC